MNKNLMNRLTMLAVTVVASVATFAQGSKFGTETGAGVVTTIGGGKTVGDTFDYKELKYEVLDNSIGYELMVIGFSNAVVNDPELMETSAELISNTVVIPHYWPADSNVPACYISSVKENAFATVSAALSAKVTSLRIDFVDNDRTNGDPVAIGANAFAGLVDLTEVKSLTPGNKVAAIPETAFDANIYKTAKLVTPDGAMGKYQQKAGWKLFYNIQSESGVILGDYDGNLSVKQNDVLKLQRALKATNPLDPYNEAVDLNGDGKVNQADYLLLVRRLKAQE